MAALQDDAVRHFDDQDNVEIQFVDEEDFPLASITEHQASDEELSFTLEHHSPAPRIRAKSRKMKTAKRIPTKKIGLEKSDAE